MMLPYMTPDLVRAIQVEMEYRESKRARLAHHLRALRANKADQAESPTLSRQSPHLRGQTEQQRG
jgi:hypothetical protein